MASPIKKAGVSHPARWVPTLYFAEGMPFFAVSLIASILYKRMGVADDVNALYTSWLLLPWSLKPLWSPLLEMFRTKKFFVVLFEFGGGLCLAMVPLCLRLPQYFPLTLALFGVVAICSSTHDIAADGLYIASLSDKQQAAYAGWQGGFYNVARFFSQGGLLIVAGYLELRSGVPRAWMVIFAAMGGLLLALSFWHSRVLPAGEPARRTETLPQAAATFRDVVATFFQKPRIWLLLSFIFLYRFAEGQTLKIGPLFLLAHRSAGGLGIPTDQVGLYNTVASIAFIGGSVLGGYFTSWLGLRRSLLVLVCAMNFRMLAWVFLSSVMPSSYTAIGLALSADTFCYGFGFVGVILLMMQEIAPGKYQTAHYAFATALMNLGIIVPGLISGKLEVALGYRIFFLCVLISGVPAVLLSRWIPVHAQERRTDDRFVSSVEQESEKAVK
ncbi:MAG TPA: MFS transporter [Verrucomicrobiae bacterium]|nr:MFS transporter [Verrucomicrobiae bacterium]